MGVTDRNVRTDSALLLNYRAVTEQRLAFNSVKCSGARQLHLKVFNAIQV